MYVCIYETQLLRYLCECMCVCMYLCTEHNCQPRIQLLRYLHVCLYVCMYVRDSAAEIYECMHACMYVCVYTGMYEHYYHTQVMSVNVWCVYACTCIHTSNSRLRSTFPLRRALITHPHPPTHRHRHRHRQTQAHTYL